MHLIYARSLKNSKVVNQMKIIQKPLFLLLIFMLSACASTEKLLTMPAQFNQKDDSIKSVSLVVNDIPNPNTYFDGADCLLCIGVAEAMNATLTNYVQELEYEEINSLKESLLEGLTKKNYQVKVVDKNLNPKELKKFSGFEKDSDFAKADYTPLMNLYETDYLIVIQIDRFGVLRKYASYIPLETPYGFIEGSVKMIELATNRYIVNMPVKIRNKSSKDWDDEPNYPHITGAYNSALEGAIKNINSLLRL